MKYMGNTKILRAFKRKKEAIFKLEGGIEIVFDENKKLKNINLPETKIFIAWDKDMPYNIKMETKEALIEVEIKQLEIRFKNGKN